MYNINSFGNQAGVLFAVGAPVREECAWDALGPCDRGLGEISEINGAPFMSDKAAVPLSRSIQSQKSQYFFITPRLPYIPHYKCSAR